MRDLLLVALAPSTGLRLAVCSVTGLARDAARRHGLGEGSAAALAQALAGSLLLAGTDHPDDPRRARVDIQLECGGPLRGLLVDADGSGAVRGMVRVGALDRAGSRTDEAMPGSRGRARQSEPGDPASLHRFEPGALLAGRVDAVAGMLSILRAAPGSNDLHRGAVPFAGADLGAGLSAFLRADRALAGELALEVLFRSGEPLAAVAGAMVLPGSEEEQDSARSLGPQLRGGALSAALRQIEESSPGNAHALAQQLAEQFQLGPLRVESEVRPRFACRCTRERVVRALSTLGAAELRDMAGKDGGASATCDFCAASYRITAHELLELAGEGPART